MCNVRRVEEEEEEDKGGTEKVLHGVKPKFHHK